MAGFFIPDPRFEMPSLLELGRKPVGPVDIDQNNDLSKKLTGCYLVQSSLKNSVPNGVDLVSGGTPYFKKGGTIIDSNGTYFRLNGVDLTSGIHDTYTITIVYSATSLPVGSFPRLWEMNGNGSTSFFRNNSDTSYGINGVNYTNNSIWGGKQHVITYGSRKADNSSTDLVNPPARKAFIDGIEVQNIEGDRFESNKFSASNWLRIGNRSDGNRPQNGVTQLILVHDKYLSNNQIKRLHAGSFQTLIPA